MAAAPGLGGHWSVTWEYLFFMNVLKTITLIILLIREGLRTIKSSVSYDVLDSHQFIFYLGNGSFPVFCFVVHLF